MAHKNIVFMVADDLGRDLGVLGNEAIDTPHLDQLAGEGTLFEKAFCTTASCSCSRSVMYTGMHNHQNGMYGLHHANHHFMTLPHIKTLPQLFGEAGYLTAIIGKIHVGPEDQYPWDYRLTEQGNRNVKLTAEALETVIAQAEKDNKPFHASICYFDPHRDPTRSGFGNTDYPGVARKTYNPEAVKVPPYLPDLPETRQELAEYYESVHRLDQGVGMVLDVLTRTGHADDTLIFFLSDNGIPFVNSKTTMYESGIHLPLIVKVPGQKAGVRNPNLVSWVDLLPTSLAWAGIDIPEEVTGRSFLDILEEASPLEDWGEIYGSHTFHEVTNYYPTRAIRTRKWKYHKNVAWKLPFPFSNDIYRSLTWEGIKRIKNGKLGARSIDAYVDRPHEELYDLEKDPHELENLAEDPAYADVLKDLRKKVIDMQLKTKDPWYFRDGTSYQAIARYEEQGLVIPEDHDMVETWKD